MSTQVEDTQSVKETGASSRGRLHERAGRTSQVSIASMRGSNMEDHGLQAVAAAGDPEQRNMPAVARRHPSERPGGRRKVENIPFLQTNADAATMFATFWIEEISAPTKFLQAICPNRVPELSRSWRLFGIQFEMAACFRRHPAEDLWRSVVLTWVQAFLRPLQIS